MVKNKNRKKEEEGKKKQKAGLTGTTCSGKKKKN